MLDKDGNEIVEETEVHVEDDHLPTDEELSAAFDDFVGEKPIVEPEEPVVVEDAVIQQPLTKTPEQIAEEVRHEEQSRLGRKVARIENLFEDLSKKILTKEDIKALKESPVVEEEISDITNVDELRTFFQKELEASKEREIRIEKESNARYQDNYLGTMKDLLADIEDEQTAKEVYKQMVYSDEFNVKLSDDPIKDSARNFNRAYKFVTSQAPKDSSRFDTPRVPNVATGVSGSNTVVKSSTRVMPKLEPDAKALMEQTGMTQEEVMDALEGDMPLSLRSKIGA
jgi:hypothetical protein